jgi:hypothetical protein
MGYNWHCFMKKMILLFGLLFFTLVNPMIYAQKKTIHVTPDKAKIFVDGNEVGNGTYTLKFDRNTDFYVLKFECPGYIRKQVKLFKNNPSKTIAYNMAKDEAFLNSIGPNNNANGEDGIDVANKWFEVAVRGGMTEDQVWKRLMAITTRNFENVEVRDKAAGWIRTAWAKTTFERQIVRTRLEIKISTDVEDEIIYKVKIHSEVNNDIDEESEDHFEKMDRVLKKYVELINELQNKLN